MLRIDSGRRVGGIKRIPLMEMTIKKLQVLESWEGFFGDLTAL